MTIFFIGSILIRDMTAYRNCQSPLDLSDLALLRTRQGEQAILAVPTTRLSGEILVLACVIFAPRVDRGFRRNTLAARSADHGGV
jgi:hypothetical protein